ncbi:25089_t:CDS:1, partial [Racocetra persica]
IILRISLDEREKPILNTPINYIKLYKKCWSTDPNQRPKLEDIFCSLEILAKEKTIEFITNEINNDTE